MILVEYVLRSELYLVLEGKLKSTFDQFMIQFDFSFCLHVIHLLFVTVHLLP